MDIQDKKNEMMQRLAETREEIKKADGVTRNILCKAGHKDLKQDLHVFTRDEISRKRIQISTAW